MFRYTYTICYRERADKGTHLVHGLLKNNILKEYLIAGTLRYYLECWDIPIDMKVDRRRLIIYKFKGKHKICIKKISQGNNPLKKKRGKRENL